MGVPKKFISRSQSLNANRQNRIPTIGDLSPTRGGDRKSFLSFFLFDFVIEMMTEVILSSYENIDADVCPDSKMSDFEYADDCASEWNSKEVVGCSPPI